MLTSVPSCVPCWSHDGSEVFLEKDEKIVALNLQTGEERVLKDLSQFEHLSRRGPGTLPGAFTQHVAQLAASRDGMYLAVSFSEAGGPGHPLCPVLIEPLMGIHAFSSGFSRPMGAHPCFSPDGKKLVYACPAGLVERDAAGNERRLVDNIAGEMSTYFSWPEVAASGRIWAVADYVHLYEIVRGGEAIRKVRTFDACIHGVAVCTDEVSAIVLVGVNPETTGNIRTISTPGGVVASLKGFQTCELLLLDLVEGDAVKIDTGDIKLVQSVNYPPWCPRLSPSGDRLLIVLFDELGDPHAAVGKLVFDKH